MPWSLLHEFLDDTIRSLLEIQWELTIQKWRTWTSSEFTPKPGIGEKRASEGVVMVVVPEIHGNRVGRRWYILVESARLKFSLPSSSYGYFTWNYYCECVLGVRIWPWLLRAAEKIFRLRNFVRFICTRVSVGEWVDTNEHPEWVMCSDHSVSDKKIEDIHFARAWIESTWAFSNNFDAFCNWKIANQIILADYQIGGCGNKLGLRDHIMW